MSRSVRLYLSDILDASETILQYVRQSDPVSFSKDRMRIEACARNIEVIGEASRCLPKTVRDPMPGIPWNRIIGMRNILAHAYYQIDYDVIWSVAHNHIDPLLKAIKTYMESADLE